MTLKSISIVTTAAYTVLRLLSMDRIKCYSGPVVSFVIHVATIHSVRPMIDMGVGVGGRINKVRHKDVIWDLNPAPLRATAIN